MQVRLVCLVLIILYLVMLHISISPFRHPHPHEETNDTLWGAVLPIDAFTAHMPVIYISLTFVFIESKYFLSEILQDWAFTFWQSFLLLVPNTNCRFPQFFVVLCKLSVVVATPFPPTMVSSLHTSMFLTDELAPQRTLFSHHSLWV